MRSFTSILLAILWSMEGLAAEGVLEINQVCATSPSGCFTGDAAGFPVTLTAKGSYILTSNLDVSGADTDAITVQGDSVTLDLRGFEIVGADEGSATGIAIDGDQVVVRDGTVRDFGGNGVRGLGRSARLEDIRTVSHGASGIELGAGAQVRRCIAESNGAHGIVVGNIGAGAVDSASSVEDSEMRGNQANGLILFNGDARRNRIVANRQIGVLASGVGQISENHIEFNGDPSLPIAFIGGIATSPVVPGGQLRIVDNLIFASGGDNVRIERAGNVIERNSIGGDGRTDHGLRITVAGNVYSGNRLTGHVTADVTSAAGNTDGGGNVSY
jgi:hypothetical protein